MATDPTSLIYQMLSNGANAGQAFTSAYQNAQQAQQQKAANDQALAENGLKLQVLQQQTAQDASYQTDIADLQANPSMDKIAALSLKYPRQAEAVKQFWAMKEPEVRQNHINAISQPLSAIENGRVDLAIAHLQSLRDASAAAKPGNPQDAARTSADADELTQEIEALQSGDRNAINAVRANMMMHLAAADPEGKFADSLAKLKKAQNGDPYTLEPGAVRYDGNNNVVARGDPKPMEAFHYTLKDKAGDEHEYVYEPSSGPLPPGAKPAPGASGAAALAPDGKLDPTAFYKQFVLPHEGGYAPHDANGAPVNHGINQSANPGVDVRNLTPDDAAQIFATKYFPSSANLPPALAAVNADTSFINPKRAAQFLQASGGDPAKYMAMRQSWMNSLVANQPQTYAKYAKAWGTRNADLLAYAQNLGGSGSPGAAPVSGGMSTAPLGGSRQIDPNPVSSALGDDTPGDLTKTGPEYLATVPSGIASTARMIINGQMAQPSSFALSKPYWQQVMAVAAHADPTLDSSTQPQRVAAAKSFTGNGKAAQTVGSIDRLAYHLNDLYRDSQALTGWNLGPLSDRFNAGVQSFQKAAVARYTAALPFVAGELQKLTKNGSATEGESKQIMANLAPTQPASARLAAMQQLAELSQGQFKPIRDQWASAFSDGRPMPMDVSPEANAILDSLSNDKGPVAIDPHTGKLAASRSPTPRPSASSPPAPAVAMLRSNPTLAQQFDQKYGLGSAARVLGH